MSMSDELGVIRARAEAALGAHSGKRRPEPIPAWRPVIANLGAGPFTLTTTPLGHRARRANAAHVAGMDPETTIALLDRVAAAEAERDALRRRLDKVREVALGRLPHRYMGGCPDVLDGWDLRDPECAACAILDAPQADNGGDGR